MPEHDAARVYELFVEACESEPSARSAFLQLECGSDTALLAEVESLFDHDQVGPLAEADGAARHGILLGGDHPLLPEGAIPGEFAEGTRIGRYTILGKLGWGGMGTVYEARQDDPARRVALKMLRGGLGSGRVAERFRHEAQVLGRLQHPGIAHIFEAGTIESAAGPLPYFAMELIRGEPLQRHADTRGLDLRARVVLMVRVCEAVAHAHRKGVVHRDLKPDNVLVDAEGRPKVLDFGVALLTSSDDALTTMHTQTGMLVGTLQYMSPEQVSGDPQRVDARADVYALGAMLYELLSGDRPYEVAGRSVPDAARMILEDEPSRLGTLRSNLRGDLEVIVEQAMAKEPGRRYADAGALADDLRRFLGDLPIVARQLSTFYFIRRFSRRHRSLVAGVVIALAALLVGLVVSMTQRGLALDAQEQMARQIVRERLSAAGVATMAGTPETARELLERILPEDRGWEWRYLTSVLDPSVFAHDFGEELVTAALAPDGESVLALLRSGALVRRGLTGAFPSAEITLDAADVRAACVSEDGRRVATLCGERWDALAMWDTQTGERLASWPGINAEPALLQLEGGRLRVLWFPTTSSMSLWDSGADAVRTFAFDDEELAADTLLAMRGDRVAIVLKSFRVELLDCAGPEVSRLATWEGVKGIRSLAVSADGRMVAVGTRDKRVQILEVETRARVAELSGHSGPVDAVAFCRQDAGLVSLAEDGTLREWDLASGRSTITPVGPGDGRPVDLRHDPRGDRILTRTEAGLVRVFDADRRTALSVLRGHTSYVYPVSFSPDGRELASGSWDGTVRLWDVDTGEGRWSVPLGEKKVGWELAYSPDGGRIAVSSNHPPVLLLDAATGEVVLTCDASLTSPLAFAWFPDAERLLLTGSDAQRPEGSSAFIVDAGDGHLASLEEVALPGINSVAISSDGELAAFSSNSGAVRVWDLERARVLSECAGHTGAIHSLAFSPEGDRLASGSQDGTARIFDVRTGATLQTLLGHRGRVYSVAWSPDGRRVATGAEDSLVRLFDPEWSEPLLQLMGHDDYVYRVAFSPDGTRIASGSGDGTVRLWDTLPLHERLAGQR